MAGRRKHQGSARGGKTNGNGAGNSRDGTKVKGKGKGVGGESGGNRGMNRGENRGENRGFTGGSSSGDTDFLDLPLAELSLDTTDTSADSEALAEKNLKILQVLARCLALPPFAPFSSPALLPSLIFTSNLTSSTQTRQNFQHSTLPLSLAST